VKRWREYNVTVASTQFAIMEFLASLREPSATIDVGAARSARRRQGGSQVWVGRRPAVVGIAVVEVADAQAVANFAGNDRQSGNVSNTEEPAPLPGERPDTKESLIHAAGLFPFDGDDRPPVAVSVVMSKPEQDIL
jgi:hypothetical protein